MERRAGDANYGAILLLAVEMNGRCVVVHVSDKINHPDPANCVWMGEKGGVGRDANNVSQVIVLPRR